jgi:hypothetical protein
MNRPFFLILVCALGILAFGSNTVFAQQEEGGVLSVSPHRLVIKPGEKSGIISVSNKSGESHRYSLILIDQVMDKKGVTQRQDTFNYSAKHMVRFSPKHFLIRPGDEQTVRVAVMRPAGLADGDYHSHLLFHEVPVDMTDEQLETAVISGQKNLYGIAMPLVIQQGSLFSEIGIHDAGLVSGTASQTCQLSIEFMRSGNAEATVKLSADYMPEGKAPITVLEARWIRLYREVDKVSREFDLANIPENAGSGKLVIYLDDNDDLKTAKKEILLPQGFSKCGPASP